MKKSENKGANGRRKQIVRKAAILFNDMGYFNTSMNDIAEAVGVRKPTLYYYISSKEEILYLVHEELIEHLTSLHQSRLETRMSCAQLLQEVLIDILEQINDYPGYVRAFFENYRELSPELKEKIKKKRNNYFQMIEDVFVRGAEQGEFHTDDPRLTALAFFGICNWAYQWYNPKGEKGPRQIAFMFWDIFMHGVKRQ